MLLLTVILAVALTVILALIVIYERVLDRFVTLVPLFVAGMSFLILLLSDSYRTWAIVMAALFLPFTALAFVVRWRYTGHGRLERAYWRKNTQAILAGLFRRYSLDSERNRAITAEIQSNLRSILPSDWHSLIETALHELAAVKVSALRMRSLGISSLTTAAYIQSADLAGEHLWRVTERVAAVAAQGYTSAEIEERLESERARIEKLIAAAGNAREALAELTLSDIGSSELEDAELQLRALASATRELEVV